MTSLKVGINNIPNRTDTNTLIHLEPVNHGLPDISLLGSHAQALFCIIIVFSTFNNLNSLLQYRTDALSVG
jgi:hypothetical protein